MLELSPFEPLNLVLIAALNPIVAIVGFVMGRTASEWRKLLLAGFSAALAGAVAIWVAVAVGFLPARGIGGEAGVFVASIGIGTLWAALGYWLAPGGRRQR